MTEPLYFCPCGNWLTLEGPGDSPEQAFCHECDKWVVPEQEDTPTPDAQEDGWCD